MPFQLLVLTIAVSFAYLKQDYNAKLSDFGLAKDGPVGDKSHVSTRIMGTYGYAAPEYIMTGASFLNGIFCIKKAFQIICR